MAVTAVLTWGEICSFMTFERPGTIQQLYRALFALRQQAPSQEEAVRVMAKALGYTEFLGSLKNQDVVKTNSSTVGSSSVLFRHECCYLLGQVGADATDLGLKKKVFQTLLNVLANEEEDEVTRHEAAEGIAAVFNHNVEEDSTKVIQQYFAETERTIEETLKTRELSIASVDSASVDSGYAGFDHGEEEVGGRPFDIASSGDSGDRVENVTAFVIRNKSLIRILERFSDTVTPLGQTCFLAVEGLKRQTAKVCACQFNSYDPAIGDPAATVDDISKYASILNDSGAEFFQRYIAMFTLRNLGASQELAHTLNSDKTSPVLRHEISFILGQMESDEARDALIQNLKNSSDHCMVRHESAIALGSVGGEEAKAALRLYSTDVEPMVAESCLVALDTIAYWEAWENEENRIKNL